ncbi:hypothetical protein Y032_0022g520 [Ancylostoma ceylanicum]|nr:hypothetical protein Y032_0022g520 [Ancylostoma ceylanicum]
MPITLEGEAIEEVGSYVYIGQEVNTSNDLTGEILRRRKAGWLKFNEEKEGESVAALKHEARIHFEPSDAAAFRKMRQMEHDNVNRFIGICLDGPQMMSIWRYGSRGSIQDVILRGSMTMDNFFVISLLNDIANVGREER